MLPLRLELRNFLAYRQPDPVILEGIHLACLSGANGAGKSSLLDAITWALWGKARVRSDDDLIFQGQTEMLVQLDFLQGDTRYRVVRKRQKGAPPRPGKSALDLYVWEDERHTWIENTAPSMRQTQQRISSLLRLEYDTFVHSAFLQQGHADAFTVQPPGKRKDILSDILGLGQWQLYETRAKERLRGIDSQLERIALRLEEIEHQEQEEPALLRNLAEAEERLAEAMVLREAAEARYQEIAGAEEQMNAARANLVQAEKRCERLERDLLEIEEDLGRFHDQQANLENVVAEQDTIQQGYAQLQAAREADQELGQKLQAMDSIKDRLNEMERRIAAERADLDSQAAIHRERIASASQTAAARDSLVTESDGVRTEVERLEAEEQRRDSLRDAIQLLNEEQAELRAANRALRGEMQAIKARMEDVQAAEATCPLCGQPLDDDHKDRLLLELQDDGTTRGDQHRQNATRIDDIKAAIQEHGQEIDEIEIELRRLQALRERAAVLGGRIEDAQAAADTLVTEQAVLEDVQQLLDSGQFALELQAQRDGIQGEIDALGYDSQAHDAARETLASYHDYEQRQRQLETALDQLPEIAERITATSARRERWQTELADEAHAIEAAQEAIAGLEELVAEARRREEELRQSRTRERNAESQKIGAEQALRALEAARARKAELEQRRLHFAEEKSIYEELRAAFGKNGIPAMIIEAAIPELEDAANRLLARMTEGRMYVRLDTQREKRTGGMAETLDILISDELGTRSYESYSGGEAFRVNFAIRVALSQVLARRAGARLRTLFLDEGFGTQDESGRQRLVEAITAVQNNFDLVLVITHIDELRDAFPVQIEITKTPNGSRVSTR